VARLAKANNNCLMLQIYNQISVFSPSSSSSRSSHPRITSPAQSSTLLLPSATPQLPLSRRLLLFNSIKRTDLFSNPPASERWPSSITSKASSSRRTRMGITLVQARPPPSRGLLLSRLVALSHTITRRARSSFTEQVSQQAFKLKEARSLSDSQM